MGDVRGSLFGLMKRFMAMILDPEVVAMYRVVMGEAASHPRVAALFFDSGPGATKVAVSALLESLVERGALRIEDMDYAAWQLVNMAFGKHHTELLLGLVDQVPEAELDALCVGWWTTSCVCTATERPGSLAEAVLNP